MLLLLYTCTYASTKFKPSKYLYGGLVVFLYGLLVALDLCMVTVRTPAYNNVITRIHIYTQEQNASLSRFGKDEQLVFLPKGWMNDEHQQFACDCYADTPPQLVLSA